MNNWTSQPPTEPGNYRFISNEFAPFGAPVSIELRAYALWVRMDCQWHPLSEFCESLTDIVWQRSDDADEEAKIEDFVWSPEGDVVRQGVLAWLNQVPPTSQKLAVAVEALESIARELNSIAIKTLEKIKP